MPITSSPSSTLPASIGAELSRLQLRPALPDPPGDAFQRARLLLSDGRGHAALRRIPTEARLERMENHRGHFWIRGAVLIALQLFVINPIWKAGPEFFPEIYIGVLIALGGTMILGSLFLQLPPIALLILTLGLLAGTEWLHPGPEMWGQLNNEPWNLILMRSGGDGKLWSNYPMLPWLELVIFGMLFGSWLRADEKKAYQKGLWIGLALLVSFVIIRYADGFGNIRPRAAIPGSTS